MRIRKENFLPEVFSLFGSFTGKKYIDIYSFMTFSLMLSTHFKLVTSINLICEVFHRYVALFFTSATHGILYHQEGE